MVCEAAPSSKGGRVKHETLKERRAEYDANVWDHTTDAFQMEFDFRRPLDEDELKMLAAITSCIWNGATDAELAREIKRIVGKDESRLFVVMQQAGLTRNKIVQDLRAASAQLSLKVPGKPIGILLSTAAWKVGGPYLAARLRKVLEPVAALEDPMPAFEAINQATWPHWIRQERAKRQGHEAEYRVAIILDSLGIPFVPEQKSENPLCADAQIDGESYDLVVADVSRPVMVMKSTVQTANIGQFGESKAHLEVTQAQAALKNRFDTPPILLAMVDGVGFRSNIAGLEGVLANADEFCQFKTIWKAPVIAASQLGLPLSLALPEAAILTHASFLGRYADKLTINEATDEVRSSAPPLSVVDAGEGFLWRD